MDIFRLTCLAVYGKENVSSGASSDIQHASGVARAMVKVCQLIPGYKSGVAHTFDSGGGTLIKLDLSSTMTMMLQCSVLRKRMRLSPRFGGMLNRCAFCRIKCWLMRIIPRLIEEGNSRVKVLLKAKEGELHRVCNPLFGSRFPC